MPRLQEIVGCAFLFFSLSVIARPTWKDVTPNYVNNDTAWDAIKCSFVKLKNPPLQTQYQTKFIPLINATLSCHQNQRRDCSLAWKIAFEKCTRIKLSMADFAAEVVKSNGRGDQRIKLAVKGLRFQSCLTKVLNTVHVVMNGISTVVFWKKKSKNGHTATHRYMLCHTLLIW